MFKQLNTLVASFICIVTLVVTLAHSTHFSKVDFNGTLPAEYHDCFLYQLEVDLNDTTISLNFVAIGIFNALKIEFTTIDIILSDYVLSLLRAPPSKN